MAQGTRCKSKKSPFKILRLERCEVVFWHDVKIVLAPLGHLMWWYEFQPNAGRFYCQMECLCQFLEKSVHGNHIFWKHAILALFGMTAVQIAKIQGPRCAPASGTPVQNRNVSSSSTWDRVASDSSNHHSEEQNEHWNDSVSECARFEIAITVT